MLTELIKLATDLDRLGLAKEADYLDRIISRAATTDAPALLDIEAANVAISMTQLSTALTPIVTPVVTAVVSPIVGDIVGKISQKVYDECFGGLSNKAQAFMNNGPTDEQNACITRIAQDAAIAELSNPANITKALGAGLGELTGGPALGSGGITGLGDIAGAATGALGGFPPVLRQP